MQGAPNTAKAYAGDWKRFGAWCAKYGLEPLPASVDTLAGFVTHLAETGKKVATIQRHCAAVAKAHALRGVDSSTDDKKFKVLMEGIARLRGIRQKQAPAFSLALFKRTVKAIDARTLAGLRDRVVLLLGFTGAFRRSELAALNVEYLSFSEEGLIVNLAKSKTNQLSTAEEKAIFYPPQAETLPYPHPTDVGAAARPDHRTGVCLLPQGRTAHGPPADGPACEHHCPALPQGQVYGPLAAGFLCNGGQAGWHG